MKKFTLNPYVLWKRHVSKKPWFKMDTDGVVSDGLVKIEMDWNRPFIDNLISMGVGGHNEEEIVENYLMLLTNAPPGDQYTPMEAEPEFHQSVAGTRLKR